SIPSKVKLVTVHGTGAGADSATGESWWQLGSPFLKKLGERLDLDPAKVEIVPFQWGHGPNSEDGRRDAGRALHDLLKGYDKAGEDYYLLGHSHGGSVIHNALLHSVAKRRPFERLKSWTTVGTPFLDYRPNRFLYQRLGVMGLTLFATALGALFIVAVTVIASLSGTNAFFNLVNERLGDQALGFFGPMILVLFLFAAVWIGLLYLTETLSSRWHPKRRKRKAADLYADRWVGLWHADDEAISALANVRHVSGDLIPSNFLVSFFSFVPILLTVVLWLYMGWKVLTDNSEVPKFWTDLLDTVERGIKNQEAANLSWHTELLNYLTASTEYALWALAAVGVYIGVTFLVTALLKFFARWIGWPIAKVMNNLIWSSIRHRAWGDDVLKEGVVDARSRPPEFSTGFNPLPDTISKPLSAHSEKHAILTLNKVREVLGMAGKPQSSPNVMTELSENLNWRELIHTSYFDIPEFVDLVAHALNRDGAAELRDDYWQPEIRKQTGAHYAAIQAKTAS
ncbi:MAG: hypothetical protein ACR2OX_02410, partial [Methyloligellaceae bacterium]